jgi:hypothetical protein
MALKTLSAAAAAFILLSTLNRGVKFGDVDMADLLDANCQ